MTEDSLNKFINSHYALVLLGSVALLFSYILHNTVPAEHPLMPQDTTGWLANVATVGIAVLLLHLLNKIYAFIREYTVVHTTLFTLMLLTNPITASTLNVPVVLAIAIAVIALILFSCFQKPDKKGRIFLATAIPVALWPICPSALYYLPAILIGVIQMQVFSFKTFLAMLLGAVMPLWLMYAFDLTDVTALQFPFPDMTLDHYMAAVHAPGFGASLVALLTGMIFGAANILKIISYRLQMRSYNGFLNILGLVATIAIITDISNAAPHIAVVMMLSAIQAGHFFTINKFDRNYIVFLTITLLLLAFSVVEIFDLY